jgi:hypothetical protein
MIYILFAVLHYNNNAVTFTYNFKNKLDCETALHNLKIQMDTSKVSGFCQEVRK